MRETISPFLTYFVLLFLTTSNIFSMESEDADQGPEYQKIAIAKFRGKLYCSLGDRDQFSYISSEDGVTWSSNQEINHQLLSAQSGDISESPAFFEFRGILFCAYKRWFDCDFNYSFDFNYTRSASMFELVYTATNDGLDWSRNKDIFQSAGAIASSSPTLVEFEGKLFCAYNSGVDNSNKLVYSVTKDGTNWANHSQVINGVEISGSPSLAKFNGKLFCAYKERDGINKLAYSFSENGNDWRIPRAIPHVRISASPSLAEFNGKLYCVYRWSDGANKLAYTFTENGHEWAHGIVLNRSFRCKFGNKSI